jgi:hypothetical protein
MLLLLLLLCLPASACPGCFGAGQPWQGAEGPGGMNLGRLKRVYSSGKYNQPVKIEAKSSEDGPRPALTSAPVRNGEPIPTRVDKPVLPRKKAPKK